LIAALFFIRFFKHNLFNYSLKFYLWADHRKHSTKKKSETKKKKREKKRRKSGWREKKAAKAAWTT